MTDAQSDYLGGCKAAEQANEVDVIGDISKHLQPLHVFGDQNGIWS